MVTSKGKTKVLESCIDQIVTTKNKNISRQYDANNCG